MIKDNTNLMSGKGEWNEEDHPRDKNGRFTNGNGIKSVEKTFSIEKHPSLYDSDIEENVRNFKEQLQQVQNGTFDKNFNTLTLGNTPTIFIEKAGLPDLPLCMTYEKVYLSMNHSGVISGNYHNLGIDTLSQLPKKLQDPLYIFKSNNPKRIEAVVDLVDNKGRKVFVSVEMNTQKRFNKNFKQVNLVVTAFGTKVNYIEKRLNEQNVIYKK